MNGLEAGWKVPVFTSVLYTGTFIKRVNVMLNVLTTTNPPPPTKRLFCLDLCSI